MKKKVLALFLSALIAVQAIVPVAAELEEVTIEENLEEEDETENDLISEEILSEDTEIILDEPEDIFEEEQIIEDELTFSEETSFIQDDFLEEESLDDSGIIVEEETTEEISEDYIFEEEELVEESMSEDYDLNAGEIELVGVSSGTCGSNLTWTLTDDGVLTISGTGSMDDWGVVYDETNEAHPTTPWVGTVKKVVIMSGVTSIGKYAFYKCSSLTSIIVSSGNPSYSSQDEVLFNKDKTVLICCPGGKSEDYVIPGSVTSIGDSAFELCSNLTNIIIPNSITKIGESAFNGCSSLLNITIPDSVTSIYGSAFYNCSSLISVTIPDSVKRIRAYTFDGCSNLTSVTLPKDVTSIEYCTFYNCSSLTSVTIPASVTRIMEKAFDGCSALRDVIYGGSEEQWNSVSISDDNDPILNATIHYSDNTYIVSFNANGGTDAPANQTKTQGVTMTLSSLKPSKKYVINYNANGGSVSPTSKTVECTFKNWNTKTPHVSTQT